MPQRSNLSAQKMVAGVLDRDPEVRCVEGVPIARIVIRDEAGPHYVVLFRQTAQWALERLGPGDKLRVTGNPGHFGLVATKVELLESSGRDFEMAPDRQIENLRQDESLLGEFYGGKLMGAAVIDENPHDRVRSDGRMPVAGAAILVVLVAVAVWLV
jgi:DNA/RNA endonuclease YhcR with UshA esterase domain